MRIFKNSIMKTITAVMLIIVMAVGMTAALGGTAKAATKIKITFSGNSGYRSTDGKQTIVIEIDKGKSTTLLTSFVRPGYTFKGWSTSSSATSATYAAGTSRSFSADTILYAVWSPNTIKITYSLSGGTWKSGNTTQTYTYGNKYTLTPPSCIRTGYTLKGWNTKSDGTGTMYQSGQTNTMFSKDTTLYAVWEGIKYTISYTGNGGKWQNGNTSQTFAYGTSVVLDPPTYTNQGYSFGGWKAPNGKVYSKGDKVTFTTNTELKAVWNANTYTITYKTGKGTLKSGSLTQTFKYGSEVTLNPIALNRSGFVQIGWAEKDGASVADYLLEQRVKFSGNKTLYPVWAAEDRQTLAFGIFEKDLRSSIKNRDFVIVKKSKTDVAIGVDQSEYYYVNSAERALADSIFITESQAKKLQVTCGVVAAINTYLYLSGQRNISGTTAYKEFQKYYELEMGAADNLARRVTGGDAFYSMNDYLEKRLSGQNVKAVWVGGDTMVEKIAKALTKAGISAVTHSITGISLTSLVDTFEEIKASTKTTFTKDEMLRGIERMLENDIPVIVGYYNPSHPLEAYERTKSVTKNAEGLGYNLVKTSSFKSHYFVVTGTYKCGIYTFLEVVMWGKKYYVSFDNYWSFRGEDIFSSYSRIVK